MNSISKIFSKSYWIDSLSNFKKTKTIVLMALMMALIIVLGMLDKVLSIKILNREVSVVFIMWPVVGALFGPIPAMIIAMIVDLLMFFIFPSGYPFYLGYTLTQMLLGFISGLFFYKQRITIASIITYRFIINIGIHVCIESFFMKDIMRYNDESFKTYLMAGLIKNLIFWPFESIIIVLIMLAFLPVFKNLRLLDDEIEAKIKLF